MKEFEKWLMETRPHHEVPSWFGGAREGWEAALAWALSESGGDCDYHIIEQELENESI